MFLNSFKKGMLKMGNTNSLSSSVLAKDVRLNPNTIIIGELRGEEAKKALEVLKTKCD